MSSSRCVTRWYTNCYVLNALCFDCSLDIRFCFLFGLSGVTTVSGARVRARFAIADLPAGKGIMFGSSRSLLNLLAGGDVGVGGSMNVQKLHRFLVVGAGDSGTPGTGESCTSDPHTSGNAAQVHSVSAAAAGCTYGTKAVDIDGGGCSSCSILSKINCTCSIWEPVTCRYMC